MTIGAKRFSFLLVLISTDECHQCRFPKHLESCIKSDRSPQALSCCSSDKAFSHLQPIKVLSSLLYQMIYSFESCSHFSSKTPCCTLYSVHIMSQRTVRSGNLGSISVRGTKKVWQQFPLYWRGPLTMALTVPSMWDGFRWIENYGSRERKMASISDWLLLWVSNKDMVRGPFADSDRFVWILLSVAFNSWGSIQTM